MSYLILLNIAAKHHQFILPQNRKGTEGQFGSEPLMFLSWRIASKLQPVQQLATWRKQRSRRLNDDISKCWAPIFNLRLRHLKEW